MEVGEGEGEELNLAVKVLMEEKVELLVLEEVE